MYPILFQLGPITIYTAGVLLLVGFLLAMFILRKLTRSAGLHMAFVLDYLFSLVLVSLIAGRMVHIVFQWDLYGNQWTDIFAVWDGGISMIGMLIGGTIYFYYLCYRHQQRFLLWMDVLIAPILTLFAFSYLALAMSDQGLSGKALGIPTNMPWGVTVDFINSPYAGTPVHPVALYMTVACVVTCSVLLITGKKKPHFPSGTLFFAGILAFCFAFVVTELLKWETAFTIFGINSRLLLAAVLSVTAILGLFRSK